MASKAQIAAEKAEFDGLTKGEAQAFFLMRRYLGGEAKYKSVRKYKARFVEEGLLTENGKQQEHVFMGNVNADWAKDPAAVTARHDSRFTEKGHALYKKMCGMLLEPVEDAYREIDLRTRAS